MDDIHSNTSYIKLEKETNLEIVEFDILSQTVQKRFSVPILND